MVLNSLQYPQHQAIPPTPKQKTQFKHSHLILGLLQSIIAYCFLTLTEGERNDK